MSRLEVDTKHVHAFVKHCSFHTESLTSVKSSRFPSDCFFEGFHKVGICSVFGFLPGRWRLCLQRSVETQLYFLWLKVATKFDSTPRLFWQSHPCHKKRGSREPPWTGLLHRRTKITGLKITYRTVGTGPSINWRTSLHKVQDLTRNFLRKQCVEKAEVLI